MYVDIDTGRHMLRRGHNDLGGELPSTRSAPQGPPSWTSSAAGRSAASWGGTPTSCGEAAAQEFQGPEAGASMQIIQHI